MKLIVSPDWAQWWKAPAFFALIGAAFAGTEIAIGSPLREAATFLAITALPAPFFMAIQFASTALHEMGHAVAAWCLGLRVRQIKVHGVRWILHGEGSEDRNLGSVDIEDRLRWDRPIPATFISLAGPATNVAVVVVAIALTAGRLPRLPLAESGTLVAIGVCNAGMAYRSLVPSATPHASDIKHVLDFWQPQSQIFARRSLSRIWGVLKGADPRQIDPEDVRRAVADETSPWRVSAAQIATYHALAFRSQHAIEYAEIYLDRSRKALAEENNEERRQAIALRFQDAALELAFGRALILNEIVDDGLTSINKSNWHTARRLYAAQALAQGDRALTRERLEHARDWLIRDQGDDSDPMWNTARLFLELVDMPPQANDGS